MKMTMCALVVAMVSGACADNGFDRVFFDRLLRIPSVTANVPEVNRAVAEVRAYLEAGGVTCVVERLPDGRDTLWAATEPGLVQDYVLCPHLDVVPASAKMFEPTIRDGIIFGRGTSDDKGNAVVAAQLLRRLVGKASVGAVFTSDEETGGLTTAHWVGKGVAARRAVLVLDSSRRSITVGQKGHVYFTLRAKGVGAHSSRPWLGKNALSDLADAWTRIRQAWKAEMPSVTEADWWHDTLEATVCHCGSVPNRIPDLAEMTVNLRFVEKGGDERCEALMRRVAPELEISKGRVSQPLVISETGGEIARLRSVMCAKWPGEDVPLRRTPGATDARHFTKSCVPVAIVGASYKGLHGDDECAILSDLDDLLELLEAYIVGQ